MSHQVPKLYLFIMSATELFLFPGLIDDFGYCYNYIWAIDGHEYVHKAIKNVTQHHWGDVFWQATKNVNKRVLIDVIA